jgi:sugar phosphate permease
MADPTTLHPSKGRWYVLLLISVMYLITYLDRVNISTAAPEISKEFGFDKVTMGVIFSAFAWAYALFQVPGGWLSDRFGARRVLTGVVGFWSIMTAATAAAFGATSFIAIRFLFGVGEAGAFPGATRAMQLWYPQRERGLVQGVTHSASRLGAAVAPPHRRTDHERVRLAAGVLHLRRGWISVGDLVGADLSQSSRRPSVREQDRASDYPRSGCQRFPQAAADG